MVSDLPFFDLSSPTKPIRALFPHATSACPRQFGRVEDAALLQKFKLKAKNALSVIY
jgi:hypothetical protein